MDIKVSKLAVPATARNGRFYLGTFESKSSKQTCGARPSAYLYVAYASAIDGTGFTLVNDPALEYMAVLATDTGR